MSTAERVAEAREWTGMTQRLVAELTTSQGVRFYPQTVAKIEKGERRLTLTEAAVLAGVLGVSLDYLADKGALMPVDRSLADAHRAGYESALQDMREWATDLLGGAS